MPRKAYMCTRLMQAAPMHGRGQEMEAVVRTVVEANPDAVQLSPGQAHLLQSIPGKAKPALVLVRNLGVPAR